jgi:hypothetical protein
MSQRWRNFRSRLRSRWTPALAALLALLAALSGAATWAQGNLLSLGWWTIDGGGTTNSTSGGLTLDGTIGQPDASAPATVGGLTLESGFWVDGTTSGNAAPSTYTVYLPLVTQGSSPAPATDPRPDLTATISLNPARTTFGAGEPVEVLVTVTNRGDTAADPFWVDLYINPSAPPTASNQAWDQRCGMNPCFGIALPVAMRLAPGQSVTLSSRSATSDYSYWLGWFASGTTDLYAYVDSWKSGSSIGAVDERDETNNRAELHGLQVTGISQTLSSAEQSHILSERPDPASLAPTP